MPKTAVGRARIRNGGTSYTKGSPAINSSQQEKIMNPQEKWEDGVREDAIALLGSRVWKTNAKIWSPGGKRIEYAKAGFGL
jgi:hypothetical protein